VVWVIARVLLIVGLVCWGLRVLLSPGETSWTAFVLGIFIWAGAAAICALALKALSRANDFWQALAAMWRPLALVLAGAFLLFLNDQGRELGVSLMIDGDGKLRFVFLFSALIYWGLNNWHSARLGIYAALENGDLGVVPAHPTPNKPNRRVVDGKDRWLVWPPRLLGVCAHLFAAINLSLAAWRQPDFALLAWTAPFGIVVFTVLVYVFDRYALSERTPGARSVLAGFASIAFAVFFLLAIAVFAYQQPAASVWSRFLWGTFTISLSAFTLLIVVSILGMREPLGPRASRQAREADDRREGSARARWTLGLFAPAFVIALLVWISAPFVGRALGSMVVAYFALGAVLAAVNVFEFAIAWAITRNWFGEGARPYVVTGIVALGFLNAWLHPFHRVRLCDGAGCRVPQSAAAYPHRPDDRPNVETAAKAWYAKAKAAFAQAHDGKVDESDRVPMVIVATAGGGIRAAYWTATVLERIKWDLGPNRLRPYLFAISGVSGGSVGATAFDAALANSDETACGEKCVSSTKFLSEDFLAPTLASGIFKDGPASFLPDLWQDDRGTALEQGFEHASQGLLERPFLSLFPYGGEAAPWRPILLLNATHEESGRRIIASHVLIERNVFVDALDGLHVLDNDVRASTAAHNSARFSYVSPAGNLGRRQDPAGDSKSWTLTDLNSLKEAAIRWLVDWNGSVIDGGYFENYGALTALELARAAEAALSAENPHVKLVLLMISSDPDLAKAHTLVRIHEPKDGKECLVSSTERERETPAPSPNYLSVEPGQVANAWLNEFVAPLQGIESAREAHGNRAAAELAIEVCTQFAQSAGSSAVEAARQTVQTQAAVTAGRGKDADVTKSEPVKAKVDKPYFAHLAMCRSDQEGDVTVQPPLGWVLSRATQTGLDGLVSRCGNREQLEQLEAALGGQPQQHAVGASAAN
jgi:heme exporter protein D